MKKVAIIFLVCILLSAAAYLVYLNKLKPSLKSSNSVSLDNTKSQNKVSVNESEKKDQPEVLTQPGKKTFSADEEVIEGNDVSVLAVDFNGKSFVPADIKIKANDWIFFRNNSLKNISLVSLQGSSFTKYPGFDSKTSTLPQKSYKFQFKIPGVYGIAESINQDLVVIVKVSE
jgi:plastocyanin